MTMKTGALSVLLSAATPALAGNAGALLAACGASPGSPEQKICYAYINGLGEGILADQIARNDGTAICLPDNISTPEIRDAIRAFVDGKDQVILQLPTGGVVTAALQAAYPCRK